MLQPDLPVAVPSFSSINAAKRTHAESCRHAAWARDDPVKAAVLALFSGDPLSPGKLPFLAGCMPPGLPPLATRDAIASVQVCRFLTLLPVSITPLRIT
jgi:hypothetical protein